MSAADKDKDEDATFDAILAAMANQKGADGKPKEKVGYEQFQKMMDETPLFMRENPTDKDVEGNYVLEALKSLVFEGEGDEVAINFKNHGNELYGQKSYKDAIEAYTRGLDSGPSDHALRVSLLNNRAACNIALKAWRNVLKDTSAIIALAAASDPPSAPPSKALYRAAQALIALDQYPEARDVVSRGKSAWTEGANQKIWEGLESQIEAGEKRFLERKERQRRKEATDAARALAIAERGLVVVNTNAPPDNPHPLDFDPSGLSDAPLYPPEKADEWVPPTSNNSLVYPVFLLYPQYNQSDFISHFHEETSFDEQLAPVFPPSAGGGPAGSPEWSEWDSRHEYFTQNLNVYVETSQRRLLKVGKEITLREVIAKAVKPANGSTPRDGIVLQDGLLSFVVLPRGKAERDWIENFKRVRDGK